MEAKSAGFGFRRFAIDLYSVQCHIPAVKQNDICKGQNHRGHTQDDGAAAGWPALRGVIQEKGEIP